VLVPITLSFSVFMEPPKKPSGIPRDGKGTVAPKVVKVFYANWRQKHFDSTIPLRSALSDERGPATYTTNGG
jgi:hypothetical protein